MRFYDEGRRDAGFEAGVELALRAMLASPKFVFRAERDPAGVKPGESYALGDFELASRLSFFLWSSIPDDELLAVAEHGRLHEPAVLAKQAQRMLADPKARALVDNFAGQWLHVRNVRSATPDKNEFPNFDDTLRQALESELDLFLDSVIRGGGSVLDLLTADYTFVNERLARHYGMRPTAATSGASKASTTRAAALLGKGGIRWSRRTPTDVARGPRQVGAGRARGLAAPAAAANAPALAEADGAKPADDARAHGGAPQQPGLRELPQRDGSDRARARELDAVGSWRTRDHGGWSTRRGSSPTAPGGRRHGLRDALLRPDVLVRSATAKLHVRARPRPRAERYATVRAIVRQAEARVQFER
jgi:hypothetical protein